MNMINGDFRLKGIEEQIPLRFDQGFKGEKNAEVPFKDMLKGLVDQVDTLQKKADISIKDLASGGNTDVHDVTIKMEEAGMAFDLMMEIRNKLLEAYQQIMRMQP